MKCCGPEYDASWVAQIPHDSSGGGVETGAREYRHHLRPGEAAGNRQSQELLHFAPAVFKVGNLVGQRYPHNYEPLIDLPSDV